MCRQLIAAEAVRIGKLLLGGDYKQIVWYHVGCVLNNKNYKDLNPEEFKGFEKIKPEDKVRLKAEFKAVKEAKPSKKKKTVDDSDGEDPGPTKQRKPASEDDCEMLPSEERSDPNSRPTRRRPGMTPEQFQRFLCLYDIYETKTPDELRTELRNNQQKTTGSKKQLVERCAEGKVMGAMPLCAQCGKGYPVPDEKRKGFVCKGYREHGQWSRCGHFAKDLQRADWQD